VDAYSGEPIGSPFEGHTGGVTSVAFSPDGKQIVSGSHDRTLRLWDVTSDQHTGFSLRGHSNYVNSVAFSPDGKMIISGSFDHTLRLWDAHSGQPIGSPLEGHTACVSSAVFSPNGKQIISGSWDWTLRLWDVKVASLLGCLLRATLVLCSLSRSHQMVSKSHRAQLIRHFADGMWRVLNKLDPSNSSRVTLTE